MMLPFHNKNVHTCQLSKDVETDFRLLYIY
uniref:Uncharacterized protein n=1 Tax=Arundo donax TaxID=35708 RepID=A0A0A9AKP1_ARUDO